MHESPCPTTARGCSEGDQPAVVDQNFGRLGDACVVPHHAGSVNPDFSLGYGVLGPSLEEIEQSLCGCQLVARLLGRLFAWRWAPLRQFLKQGHHAPPRPSSLLFFFAAIAGSNCSGAASIVGRFTALISS